MIARRRMDEQDRDEASLLIFERIIREPWFQRAIDIAIYLPTAVEVNTWPLIERAWRMKKRVFSPVVEKDHAMRFTSLTADTELAFNRYGIPEPIGGRELDAMCMDIVFLPLVAFDVNGNRIGMGGGFYDRKLSFARHREQYARPKLIGLAFDCQRVQDIPASPWDIPLFQVVTETYSYVRKSQQAQ